MSDFRVIVTGSRDLPDGPVGRRLMHLLADVPLGARLVIVHGACPTGADEEAARFGGWAKQAGAEEIGMEVEVEPHPADWDGPCTSRCRPNHRRPWRDGATYCPAAGARRNREMADLGADLCLAFPLGRSPGTRDMIRKAKAAGVPVEVVEG